MANNEAKNKDEKNNKQQIEVFYTFTSDYADWAVYSTRTRYNVCSVC